MNNLGAYLVQPTRAQDVLEGDYVLGTLHGPSWPLETLRVTKSCWNGNSRTERRIETFTRQTVIDKDALILVIRGQSG